MQIAIRKLTYHHFSAPVTFTFSFSSFHRSVVKADYCLVPPKEKRRHSTVKTKQKHNQRFYLKITPLKRKDKN